MSSLSPDGGESQASILGWLIIVHGLTYYLIVFVNTITLPCPQTGVLPFNTQASVLREGVYPNRMSGCRVNGMLKVGVLISARELALTACSPLPIQVSLSRRHIPLRDIPKVIN